MLGDERLDQRRVGCEQHPQLPGENVPGGAASSRVPLEALEYRSRYHAGHRKKLPKCFERLTDAEMKKFEWALDMVSKPTSGPDGPDHA